jgi:carboxypeptidase C (cathepsin A)
VGNNYKLGDQLIKNEYSWNKAANLLFLESPATVGFSSDKDIYYPWTDLETAQDAFAAIKDFIFVKAPEFSNRTIFVKVFPFRLLVKAMRVSTFPTSQL